MDGEAGFECFFDKIGLKYCRCWIWLMDEERRSGTRQ